jgi:ribosomal 30S subunit maturation factor RimM
MVNFIEQITRAFIDGEYFYENETVIVKTENINVVGDINEFIEYMKQDVLSLAVHELEECMLIPIEYILKIERV